MNNLAITTLEFKDAALSDCIIEFDSLSHTIDSIDNRLSSFDDVSLAELEDITKALNGIIAYFGGNGVWPDRYQTIDILQEQEPMHLQNVAYFIQTPLFLDDNMTIDWGE